MSTWGTVGLIVGIAFALVIRVSLLSSKGHVVFHKQPRNGGIR